METQFAISTHINVIIYVTDFRSVKFEHRRSKASIDIWQGQWCHYEGQKYQALIVLMFFVYFDISHGKHSNNSFLKR